MVVVGRVKSAEVESEQVVADRIRRGLEFVSADRLTLNPDCGRSSRACRRCEPSCQVTRASPSERIPPAVLWLRWVIAAGRG